MIKNPNWQEATSWIFTSVAEDLNSGRPRTNARPDPGTAGLMIDDRLRKVIFDCRVLTRHHQI